MLLASGKVLVIAGYGPNVHVLADAYLLSLLAKLCADTTVQPEISQLVTLLYHGLAHVILAQEFPSRSARVFLGDEELADLSAPGGGPESTFLEKEADGVASRVDAVLRETFARLEAEDRMLLRLRFRR